MSEEPSSGPASSPQLDLWLKRVFLVVGIMLVIAGSVFVLRQLGLFTHWFLRLFGPFLIGYVLAYILNPIVGVVQTRLRLGRVTGMLVCILFVVALISIMLLWLLPNVFEQMKELFQSVRAALETRVESLKQGSESTIVERARTIVARLELDFDKVANALLPGLSNAAESAGAVAVGIWGGVSRVFHIFSFLVLAGVVTFYLLLDFHRIRGVVAVMLPSDKRERIFAILGKVDKAVGGFLRGQLIDCLLVGILTMVGLLAVGMGQYALLIGTIAGTANFIPYLGPVMGATPALLWIWLSDYAPDPSGRVLGSLYVIMIFAAIQTIDGFIFQPRIVGKSSQLHPLAVIFALVVGAQFGISGMVLAVPAACIIRVLLKELWWDKRSAEAKAASVKISGG
ncbi:MAG: AI-2E family transporter [bacterium]